MFILASASPRREGLLKQIGACFTVKASSVLEIKSDDIPADLVVHNALAKAKQVAAKYPNIPVLAADTVVVVDNDILGKPRDKDDAVVMLSKIAGRTHEVFTGIAWIYDYQIQTSAVMTQVTFVEMSRDDIIDYVACGESLDKAGGYAIQGKAAAYISGIVGSFTNVVGLPLHTVRELAHIMEIDLYGNAS